MCDLNHFRSATDAFVKDVIGPNEINADIA